MGITGKQLTFGKTNKPNPVIYYRSWEKKNHITCFQNEQHFAKIIPTNTGHGLAWAEGIRCVPSEQGECSPEGMAYVPNYYKPRRNAPTSLPGFLHFCVLCLSFSYLPPYPHFAPTPVFGFTSSILIKMTLNSKSSWVPPLHKVI